MQAHLREQVKEKQPLEWRKKGAPHRAGVWNARRGIRTPDHLCVRQTLYR